MNEHEKINYVEFPAKNIEAAKAFFTEVFGWSFVDYGPEYTAFSNEGIDGGFFQSNLSVSGENGSALIIFYSKDLEQTQAKIKGLAAQSSNQFFHFPEGTVFILLIPMATNMQCGQM